MHYRKLFFLTNLLFCFSACVDCLDDACVRNEFAIHAGRMNTLGNTTANKVSDLTPTGPCIVDTHTYDCTLAKGCDNVAIIGTGVGTCHLQGHGTATGAFSVDVQYSSCIVKCGGQAVFVTDHYDVFLSDGTVTDGGI